MAVSRSDSVSLACVGDIHRGVIDRRRSAGVQRCAFREHDPLHGADRGVDETERYRRLQYLRVPDALVPFGARFVFHDGDRELVDDDGVGFVLERLRRPGHPDGGDALTRFTLKSTTHVSTTDDTDDREGTTVSLSRKGQATIPKDLRDKHGIEPG
jgi:hypothetical protein